MLEHAREDKYSLFHDIKSTVLEFLAVVLSHVHSSLPLLVLKFQHKTIFAVLLQGH